MLSRRFIVSGDHVKFGTSLPEYQRCSRRVWLAKPQEICHAAQLKDAGYPKLITILVCSRQRFTILTAHTSLIKAGDSHRQTKHMPRASALPPDHNMRMNALHITVAHSQLQLTLQSLEDRHPGARLLCLLLSIPESVKHAAPLLLLHLAHWFACRPESPTLL